MLKFNNELCSRYVRVCSVESRCRVAFDGFWIFSDLSKGGFLRTNLVFAWKNSNPLTLNLDDDVLSIMHPTVPACRA